MSIGNEIVTILILIVVNGILAMSEASLVASRKARLQQKAGEGDRGSSLALKLVEDPNTFLSTTQIGITLIGVLAGAVGGATISDALAGVLVKIPFLRSEERRVGKECRSRGWAYHVKKKKMSRRMG